MNRDPPSSWSLVKALVSVVDFKVESFFFEGLSQAQTYEPCSNNDDRCGIARHFAFLIVWD